MLRRDFIALLFSFVLDLFGFREPEKLSNVYKFRIGRSAFKIMPNESFSAKIHWPVNAVVTDMDRKVLTEFGGFLFKPLDSDPDFTKEN